ncbi:unnamed protein product [Rhizopus stolonifer]
MKSSINTQLTFGIANPTSFGLLVEGFRCSLHRMVLVADGIYLPVMVNMFILVEYTSDLMNIPTIVESLYYVKEGIAVLKEKLKFRKKEEREREREELEEFGKGFLPNKKGIVGH